LQPVLQQRFLRTLQQPNLGRDSLGSLKQCDFLQQPLLQQLVAGAQQVGAAAGAQQLGAQAAGAAQVGAQAAGAAQVGAGAQHEGAAPQQPRLNRPASALLMLAKQTSAAEIQTYFI
jgi:hypothetical protein